jgi:hypothetical protein
LSASEIRDRAAKLAPDFVLLNPGYLLSFLTSGDAAFMTRQTLNGEGGG